MKRTRTRFLNYGDIELMYRDRGFKFEEAKKDGNVETRTLKKETENDGTYFLYISISTKSDRGSPSYGKVGVVIKKSGGKDEMEKFVYDRTPDGLVLLENE